MQKIGAACQILLGPVKGMLTLLALLFDTLKISYILFVELLM